MGDVSGLTDKLEEFPTRSTDRKQWQYTTRNDREVSKKPRFLSE